jgi:hypothetical protein
VTVGAPHTALPNTVRWALNAARPRSHGLGCRSDPTQTPGLIVRAYGHAVYLAARTANYATGISAKSRYTHLVRRVYLAWRTGRIRGTAVHYWCGGSTYDAYLSHDPTRELCFMCQARYARYGP